MNIETFRRDPNQIKNYVEYSDRPFHTPDITINEYGVTLVTEQEGDKGVKIVLSLSHSDIYDILKMMCEKHPDKSSHIVNAISGYLKYKENHIMISEKTL